MYYLIDSYYPSVFPGFPIAFFSSSLDSASKESNANRKDFEEGKECADIRMLRKKYRRFIIKSGRTDYDAMRKECDHAQEMIMASIKECESSNSSKDALFTRLLAIVALCISVVSMLWSDCFQMTSYDWLRDLLGDKFPKNLPLKDSQMIAVDAVFTTVIIILIVYATLSDKNDQSRKTRRKYCNAYQCYEVFKLALLDVQKESELDD